MAKNLNYYHKCIKDAGKDPSTDTECEMAEEANKEAKKLGLSVPYPKIEKSISEYEKKNKKESMNAFVSRRNKETGKRKK